jgi:DHA1 family tetracycline resistance protein-like MFS transporter
MRRAAFAFIFVTVFLDMMALGVVIPVLPKLVVDFVGGNTSSAATIYGLFGTIYALMQFLFSPLQGALSDHFGRRPVVLISNFGLGLASVLMALAPGLSWLLAARIVAGVTSASIATAYAYIADVTPAEQRSARFGLLGAAFGIGFVLGPAIGGITGSFSPRLPFWIAAGFSLANALYGFFVLPESLQRELRAPFALAKANPLGSMRLLTSHRRVMGLAVVNFLGKLAQAAMPSVGVIYMIHRYGWDEQTVGYTMAGVGVATIIVQGGMVKPIVARHGVRTALIAGLLFGTAGFLVAALASSSLGFWLAIPLIAVGGLAGPTVQGLMSARFDATEQGQLQGANASITGIANFIGPGLFSQAFALFTGIAANPQFPGAPFLVAAALLGAGAVLVVTGSRKREAPHPTT